MLKSLGKRFVEVCRNRIQKSIMLFNKESYELEKELEEPVELGLKEYIEFVVREVRKANKH